MEREKLCEGGRCQGRQDYSEHKSSYTNSGFFPLLFHSGFNHVCHYLWSRLFLQHFISISLHFHIPLFLHCFLSSLPLSYSISISSSIFHSFILLQSCCFIDWSLSNGEMSPSLPPFPSFSPFPFSSLSLLLPLHVSAHLCQITVSMTWPTFRFPSGLFPLHSSSPFKSHS